MQEETRGGAGVDAALQMLDLFASVGVTHFDVTHTNIDEEKRGFRAKRALAEVRTSMRFLVPASFQRQNNVIVRPRQPEGALVIQLDDLAAADLERVRPAAFMTVATSPGNFQAWLAVAGEIADRKDFARRVRKAAGADPSASGAVRVAGTANYKRKYEPGFPVVAVDLAAPGRTVTEAELKASGLLAPPEATPPAPARVSRISGPGRWPSYQLCVTRAPKAHGADRPDISRADFTFCMTAIDWGFSIEATAARLMEESGKAREQGQSYAMETARNAAAAVQRRRGARMPEYGL